MSSPLQAEVKGYGKQLERRPTFASAMSSGGWSSMQAGELMGILVQKSSMRVIFSSVSTDIVMIHNHTALRLFQETARLSKSRDASSDIR